MKRRLSVLAFKRRRAAAPATGGEPGTARGGTYMYMTRCGATLHTPIMYSI